MKGGSHACVRLGCLESRLHRDIYQLVSPASPVCEGAGWRDYLSRLPVAYFCGTMSINLQLVASYRLLLQQATYGVGQATQNHLGGYIDVT